MQGHLRKLVTSLNTENEAIYQLPLGDQLLELNSLIGQRIRLCYTGKINCLNCGKATKKSYAQGHCYVCMQKLASCDMCVMKPETCHFAQGTCREPSWAEQNCFVPHYVYLANTSGLKVGITRHTQLPTRWIDQGATQALPIFKVSSRHISGLVEVALAKFVADKTHWQAMLKGNHDSIDLKERAAELIAEVEAALADIIDKHGEQAIERVDCPVQTIHYPVTEFPKKIKSYNLDKVAEIDDVLIGIKGQYLIFENGVINIRKYSAYELSVVA